MLDDLRLGIVGHQIIVLVVPGECEGADLIEVPLPAEPALLVHGIVKIAKADLPVLGDAAVDLVHIIIDGLVHGLDAVGHKDLAAELPGLIDAGQALDLFDEGDRLLVGDELGGLDAVHQQLQLGQLKVPVPHIVAIDTAALHLDHVQAEQPQGLDIVIDALALCRNIFFRQTVDDLIHRHRMLLIRTAQQKVHHIQQL